MIARPRDRLLVDTHVFLWWAGDDAERLASPARDALADARVAYVSVASAWELAIKSSLGKLRVDVSFREALRITQCEPLAITLDHTERVATLPRHHGDPFDRLLAAQAAHEGLTLVTHDRAFAPYGLPTIWT